MVISMRREHCRYKAHVKIPHVSAPSSMIALAEGFNRTAGHGLAEGPVAKFPPATGA
jgi:hypothetical protein